MTHTEILIMALLAACGLLFILPASAARRGGFDLLRAFSIMCRRWLVLCLLGATLAVSGCGSTEPVKPEETEESLAKEWTRDVLEDCGNIRSANTCTKAKDYLRCLADHNGAVEHWVSQRRWIPAKENVEIECGDADAKKGSPYQQVCPEGAACNQGVQ